MNISNARALLMLSYILAAIKSILYQWNLYILYTMISINIKLFIRKSVRHTLRFSIPIGLELEIRLDFKP